MLKRFLKQFSKHHRRIKKFNENTHIDLPGYGLVTYEDLVVACVSLEKAIKQYYEANVGKVSNQAKLNKLIDAIDDYPPSGVDDANWKNMLQEIHEARKVRNKIIHVSLENSKQASELIALFNRARTLLCQFTLLNPTYDRIKVQVKGEIFLLSVDSIVIELDLHDIKNLTLALDSPGKNRVSFIKGKPVASYRTSQDESSFLICIADTEPFHLNSSEIMCLTDLLSSHICYFLWGKYPEST